MTLTKARDIPNLSRGLLQIATAWVKCTIRCKLWALLCIEIVSVNADAASSRAIEFYDDRLIKKVWGAVLGQQRYPVKAPWRHN